MKSDSSKTRSNYGSNGRRILVTGGSGFIGSAFLRKVVVENPDILFINLDDLSSSVDFLALQDVEKQPNYIFVEGDVTDREFVTGLFKRHDITDVIHFAADSDVDHSIRNPWATYKANVLGTLTLLAVSVAQPGFGRFHLVSTDEVYGPSLKDPFKETDVLNPTNPYSASKAAAEHMVRAYANTYKVTDKEFTQFKPFDYVITRGCNTFGPYQTPTKLIPRALKFLKEGKSIPVYGQGQAIREWIYVDAHADAIWFIFNKGQRGETYNIGSGVSYNTIEIANILIKALDLPEDRIQLVADRPGHDMKYAVDSSKIVKEGWTVPEECSIVTALITSTAKWFWQYGK